MVMGVFVDFGIENVVVVDGLLVKGLLFEGFYDVIFVDGVVEILLDELLV